MGDSVEDAVVPALSPVNAMGAASQQLRVDATGLKSTYCNVCNASATREEVVLNFGINHDWERTHSGGDVQLLHRIILSPQGAKQVSALLARVMQDYESRHGALS
jgi:hypothetical protein